MHVRALDYTTPVRRRVEIHLTVLTTPVGWLSLPQLTVLSTSLNRCVIEVFGGVFVLPRGILVHLSRRLKCTIVITSCPSSVVRPSVVNFHIFDFFSETVERNSTKLDSKQDLNVLFQVCVFRADRKNKMAASGLWLAETFSTSSLKPLNGIQRNLTGSKISTSSINRGANRRVDFYMEHRRHGWWTRIDVDKVS